MYTWIRILPLRNIYLYTILLLAGCHSATTIKYPPGGYSYPESFSDYDQRQISITQTTFDSLVSVINASSFWQTPYDDPSAEAAMDGDGFSLEANIADRYKLVRGIPATEAPFSYRKAWQQLVKRAGMKSPIHLFDRRTTNFRTVRPS
jgi:hypothetical protein